MRENHNGKIVEQSAISPWIETNNIDWSCITAGLKPKKYNKNEVIFQQDGCSEYVYLIKDGRIRLDIYSITGDDKTIFIAGRGTFIGDLAPIDNLNNICRATASTNSEVYLILKSDFIRELNTNIRFTNDMLTLYAKKIRLMVENIKQLSFYNASYRVCHALVHLANQYSTPTPEGYKLSLKFTHQEMATLTGLSRVSVSNILSDLQSNGMLKKMDGYLLIKDIDAILAYSSDME